MHKIRLLRLAAGLCVACGDRPIAAESKLRCDLCLAAQREKKNTWEQTCGVCKRRGHNRRTCLHA